MKIVIGAALAVMAVAADPGHATGLATCQSGPESGWRSQDALKQRLTGQGWQSRRIKVDGGCYEVYALDDCLVAGRYWDQVSWALEEHAWRFEPRRELTSSGRR